VTPLNAAPGYLARGLPVFPCDWRSHRRKAPLTIHGFYDASGDPLVVSRWWKRWPQALIAFPTGRTINAVVLDIDVKHDRVNGFDGLDQLGCRKLPQTPMARTPSGGLHLYFALPDGGNFPSTVGERGQGIGSGPLAGRRGVCRRAVTRQRLPVDPQWNFDAVPLAPVPSRLMPRRLERIVTGRPVKPANGLSPYAEAALDGACRHIISAPARKQVFTFNGECFSIGTLAGAGAIPCDFALRALIWAARQIPDYDRRRPWRARQIGAKVNRSFEAGMRRPRETRRV
jgi:hypothetical protein